MLVVPTTKYNKEVPVIIGTNVIGDLKESLPNAEKVPLESEFAYEAIQNDRVGVARTTRKLTLQPNEAKTIRCLVRRNENIETEPTEKAISARVTVCPRVVRVDKPGKTARIPVWVCNMSAKSVTLHAQSEVCNWEVMKVLDRDPVKEMADRKQQVEHHQQSIGEKKVYINLGDSVLTSEQKEIFNSFSQDGHKYFHRVQQI